MDGAVWGVIGTVIGGLLTAAGNWSISRTDAHSRAEAASSERALVARQERRQAYLRLLLVCREMRSVARSGSTPSVDELDRLRRELSLATYEIDLASDPVVSGAAHTLAMEVRSYVNAALTAQGHGDGERLKDLEALRVSVRGLVDQFIDVARAELAGGREL